MCKKEFDINKSERRCPDVNHLTIQTRCVRMDGRGHLSRVKAINGVGIDTE